MSKSNFLDCKVSHLTKSYHLLRLMQETSTLIEYSSEYEQNIVNEAIKLGGMRLK
jgi:hypothetical protein